MMRRTVVFAALSCALLSTGGAQAERALGRGTPQRLAHAAKLRKVRAGTEPSAVTAADPGRFVEMSHLLAPNAQTVVDYVPFRRVIFLSDGDPRKWPSLAEPIFHAFPDKLIVKGDYDIQGTHRHGNFVAMHMDNTRALPLPSGSADLVVMRRGLYLCHGATLCGGLKPEVASMRRFFRDVYRILDPKNPSAVAYLQGSHGGPARVEAFRQAADELMAQDPAMRVEFVAAPGVWHAARITHAERSSN